MPMSMSAADWTRMQRRKAGNTYVLKAQNSKEVSPTAPRVLPYGAALLIPRDVGGPKTVRPASDFTNYKASQVSDFVLYSQQVNPGPRSNTYDRSRGRFVINAANLLGAIYWNPVGTEELYILDGAGGSDTCNSCGEFVCDIAGGQVVQIESDTITAWITAGVKGSFRCDLAFSPLSTRNTANNTGGVKKTLNRICAGPAGCAPTVLPTKLTASEVGTVGQRNRLT